MIERLFVILTLNLSLFRSKSTVIHSVVNRARVTDDAAVSFFFFFIFLIDHAPSHVDVNVDLMARIEEKLYLQHVFDAIDQVYQIRTPYSSNYEERLRHSLNKLLIPEWYKHHSNLSSSTRQKSRSQGQVRHFIAREDQLLKTTANETTTTTNNKDNHSTGLLQRFSSSSIEINDQRRRRRPSASKNLYSSGRERVSQSSTWYKPTSLMIQSSREDQMIIGKCNLMIRCEFTIFLASNVQRRCRSRSR